MTENLSQIYAVITHKNVPAELKFLLQLPAKQKVYLLSHHQGISPCTRMLCKIYLSLNCRVNIFPWNILIL